MSAASENAGAGSPFWRFSLALYRRPDVANACLALQDRHGLDVNLLLFLLWLATSRRRLAAEAVRALDQRLSGWRSQVVVPLREMRRTLKSEAPLVDAGAAVAFRERVKALELEAERLQQEAMHALAGDLASEPTAAVEAAARANLDAYAGLKGSPFDRAVIEVLIAAVSGE